MVLSAGQWYFVRLCEEKCSIQIDIVTERREQICDDLMPAAAKPEACVPCPVCSEPHVKYKSLVLGRTDICRKKEVFIQEDWYRNLFTSTGILYL